MEEIAEKIRYEVKRLFNYNNVKFDFSSRYGDFSTNFCFEIARKTGEKPSKIAENFLKRAKMPDEIDKVEEINGFLNFFLNRKKFALKIFNKFFREEYKRNLGNGEVIVIDMSSPNIAKPMSIAHLRSTVIGDSLARILRFLGYKVITDNHIGDWGTQFGKLIYAYKSWGDEKKLKEDPINHLLNLYVKFHEMMEKDKNLEDKGREWFKKLENKDEEARELWKKFVDLSLKEFNKIYERLDVKIDYTFGESFYEDMLKDVINEILEKGIGKEENNAVVVEFDDLPAALIRKSDGTTLYLTRDIATVKFRKERFRFKKCLYVVGSDQDLHFRQLAKICDMLNYCDEEDIEHVKFGLMYLPEGKMSTRKGRVIFLEEVLDEAKRRALIEIEKRNADMENKEEIADKVGIAAVKYFDLSRNRLKDITFDWNKAINFEGNSGPYLQYSLVRAKSILRKADREMNIEIKDIKEEEFRLIKLISRFPDIVELSGEKRMPNYLAEYLNEICTEFNKFYEKYRVIGSEEENFRLNLVKLFALVLEKGMELLNLPVVEKL